VLKTLLQRRGSWTSGEEIAADLNISRTAIWKHIRSLRLEGCHIEASTKRGYRISDLPDLLLPEIIKNGLDTKFVGQTIHHFAEVSSTNALAKDMAPSAKEGTVILTEVQTEGKGRMDRFWNSPPGGVWMSVIFKPDLHPTMAFKINIAFSVAIARTLSCLYGLDVGIKWPNDLTIMERKICGILIEMNAEIDRLNYVVAGAGINANVCQDKFPIEWRATSLREELGRKVSRVELVQNLLREIEIVHQEMISSFEEVHAEWLRCSVTLGRRVRIISRRREFEGVAFGLDEDGALWVRENDGTETKVLAGDCIHLRSTELGDGFKNF